MVRGGGERLAALKQLLCRGRLDKARLVSAGGLTGSLHATHARADARPETNPFGVPSGAEPTHAPRAMRDRQER